MALNNDTMVSGKQALILLRALSLMRVVWLNSRDVIRLIKHGDVDL